MNEWYFHNISEDIIYGPINDRGVWRGQMRELKKKVIIRRYGNDACCNITALQSVLAEAVMAYRKNQ